MNVCRSIADIARAQTANVVYHHKVDGCMPEADRRTNALSRALVRSMRCPGPLFRRKASF